MALNGSCAAASVRAPARSFADRARGLRETSRSLGAIGPRVIASNVGSGMNAGRHMPRSPRRTARARGKELLHDAVFERMKCHDHEPPAGFENSLGGVQRAHQFAEFVVDGDPQSLKNPRSGVNAARLLPDQRGYQIRKLFGGLEWLPAPRLDNCACNGASAALFAVMVENVGQFRFRRFVDEIGRAGSVALHAHVERPVVAERKPALCLVELHRRNPDVEHDAVDAIRAFGDGDGIEIAEMPSDERQTALGFGRKRSAAQRSHRGRGRWR